MTITSRESNLSVMIDKLLFILQNPNQVFCWNKLTRWKKWGSRLQTKAGQNSRVGSGVGGDSEETSLELSTRFWNPWGESLRWCHRPLLTDQEANCWNQKLGTNHVKLGWGCSICGQVGRGLDPLLHSCPVLPRNHPAYGFNKLLYSFLFVYTYVQVGSSNCQIHQ